MSMSSMSPSYQKMWSWQPKPMSQNAGLAHNRQNDVAEQNAKTGSKLSVQVEHSASNAQMFLNMLV